MGKKEMNPEELAASETDFYNLQTPENTTPLEPDFIDEIPQVDDQTEQTTEQEPETPTQGKRGRKRISPEEKKRRRKLRDQKKAGQTIEPKNESDIVDQYLREHNETTSKIEAGQLQDQNEPIQPQHRAKISGMILLTVIDAFFPLLLIKIGGIVDKRFKKIDVQKIKLTQEEKEELSVIADEVAGMIDANPVLLLSISLGGIYLSKITGEF